MTVPPMVGISLTKEQIDREKAAVKAYQELQRAKKIKKKNREQKRIQKENPIFHEDQDDTFYYIAGYTSGGAPYGVTWEEMGLKPGMWESGDLGEN